MKSVCQILQEIRPEADFGASHDFVEDGLLDSFDVVTLVSELEDVYSISITGTDILPENFHNIAAINALLDRYGVHQ
jgi:acyl carrier protein